MSRWTPSRYVRYGRKEDNYEWTQTPDDVTITLKVTEGITAKDLDIKITSDHLRVAEKSGKVYIDVFFDSFFFSPYFIRQ